jgi:peptidoglycan/LPS O-acetylase OafA/YrhL
LGRTLVIPGGVSGGHVTTYPFYLLHDIVGAAAIRWLVDLGVNRWVALATALSSVATLSIGISSLVEPKLRTVLRGLIEAATKSKALRPASGNV